MYKDEKIILNAITAEKLKISKNIDFLREINDICNNSIEKLETISNETMNNIYLKLNFNEGKIQYYNSCIKFLMSERVVGNIGKEIKEKIMNAIKDFVLQIKDVFSSELANLSNLVVLQQKLEEFEKSVVEHNYNFESLLEYKELLDLLILEESTKIKIIKDILISRTNKLNNNKEKNRASERLEKNIEVALNELSILDSEPLELDEEVEENIESVVTYSDDTAKKDERKIILFFNDDDESLFVKQYDKLSNKEKNDVKNILDKIKNNPVGENSLAGINYVEGTNNAVFYLNLYDFDLILEIVPARELNRIRLFNNIRNKYKSDNFNYNLNKIRNNKELLWDIEQKTYTVLSKIYGGDTYHV